MGAHRAEHIGRLLPMLKDLHSIHARAAERSVTLNQGDRDMPTQLYMYETDDNTTGTAG